MLSLYEKIDLLCKEEGINITEMCKRSGASRGSLTDLKKGRKKSLTADTLAKIANYFGVSVDSLLPEAEVCKECNYFYSPRIPSDVEKHLEHHEKWKKAKEKFGFWNDDEREIRYECSEYEKNTANPFEERLKAAEKCIFAYFSRSVESDCDLSHISFEEYVPYFLHSQKHRFSSDVRNALIAKYGEKEGMSGSYWTQLDKKETLKSKIKKLIPAKGEPEITFDDFTYAFLDESKELTQENKQKLLEMAKFFKQQQDKENNE
ncbi:helix-turn-helix domain-containing protein [Clostridium merdae]|uniref:helix-turn-helix domain-containing protein n=1 Tax=Clostridium merdae TaxID=1958780 RepID=UPI000A26B331|nr:helix-turn-helix transcriptional regulator [Clostridium merdae]